MGNSLRVGEDLDVNPGSGIKRYASCGDAIPTDELSISFNKFKEFFGGRELLFRNRKLAVVKR